MVVKTAFKVEFHNLFYWFSKLISVGFSFKL